MTTYSDAVGPTALTADTEIYIGGADITIPTAHRQVTIKKIRFSSGNVVDAKAHSGKLELKIKGLAGPFKFAVGKGNGGAANSVIGSAEEIDVDIPNVSGGATVGIYATMSETEADGIASITWIAQ